MRSGGCACTTCLGGDKAAVELGDNIITEIHANPLSVLSQQLSIPLHKVLDRCPLYYPDGRTVETRLERSINLVFKTLLDGWFWIGNYPPNATVVIRPCHMVLDWQLDRFGLAFGESGWGAPRDPCRRRRLRRWGQARLAELAGPGFRWPLDLGLQVPEVGDRTYMWGPHGSEMSCGTQLSKRGREGQTRGRKDISSELANRAPVLGWRGVPHQQMW